jgi:hypothetical protein
MKKIVLSMCVLGLNISVFGAGNLQAPNPLLSGGQAMIPALASEVKPEDRYPVLKQEALNVIQSVRNAIEKNKQEISAAQQLIPIKEADLSKLPMMAFGEQGNAKDALKVEIDNLKKKVTQLSLVNQKLDKRVKDAEHIMSFAHLPVTNINPKDQKVTDGHILSSYGCVIVKATTGRRCDIPGVNVPRGNFFQRMMGSGQPVAPVAAVQ